MVCFEKLVPWPCQKRQSEPMDDNLPQPAPEDSFEGPSIHHARRGEKVERAQCRCCVGKQAVDRTTTVSSGGPKECSWSIEELVLESPSLPCEVGLDTQHHISK